MRPPEDATTRLDLPYIATAQAQKHVTHNEALLALDALVQPTVASVGADSPPESAVDGECHAVGAAPTGAWEGEAHALAQSIDGGWRFHRPRPGWTCRRESDGRAHRFDGDGWVSDTAGATDSVERLGVNQPADPNHPLAVTGASARLGHAGGSHRLYIDKASAGETASVVFQDAGSGRAEIGLIGDDALAIKVSPDGDSWSLAASFQPGATTLPNGTLFRASGGPEGGELRLEKPHTGSSLGGDVVVDVLFNLLRIFDGANGRGFVLDLSNVEGQARLWHSQSDLRLRRYAPGELPSPSIGAGTLAYLREAEPCVVFSDGASWRRMHDRSPV